MPYFCKNLSDRVKNINYNIILLHNKFIKGIKSNTIITNIANKVFRGYRSVH